MAGTCSLKEVVIVSFWAGLIKRDDHIRIYTLTFMRPVRLSSCALDAAVLGFARAAAVPALADRALSAFRSRTLPVCPLLPPCLATLPFAVVES